MIESQHNTRLEVLEQRVHSVAVTTDNLIAGQQRMDKKLDDIGETLQVFARIEERQIATNERMAELSERTKDQEQRLRSIEMALPENLDKRLSIIEAAMPQLKETRRWVVMGILGGLGMMGTAVGHMILTK